MFMYFPLLYLFVNPISIIPIHVNYFVNILADILTNHTRIHIINEDLVQAEVACGRRG